MTYCNDATKSSNLLQRLLETAIDILNNAAQRHKKRRLYKSTYEELRSLSGRELADLGIHATEIKRISWEVAYGTSK